MIASMRLVFVAAALSCVNAQALEVRLCGDVLRTFPLHEQRELNSAVVHAFAVVNSGAVAERLDRLDIELLDHDLVRDRQSLYPADVARAAATGARMAGLSSILPSLFCNGKLLQGAKLAANDMLAPGEAVIFMNQVVAWSGSRDTLRVTAGSARAELRIDTRPARTQALWPIAGVSYVAASATLHSHHRWAALEEFAFDVVTVKNGRRFRGEGLRASDYFIYGKPVRAMADGVVVAAVDGRPDSTDQFRRRGESDAAWNERVGAVQSRLLSQGFEAVLGNHVVIQHPDGEYSVYAHLRPRSISVRAGASVAAGRKLGEVGTSGNSTEPHLHFQMSDCADVAACRAIPIRFKGIQSSIDGEDRLIQTGDFVETIE